MKFSAIRRRMHVTPATVIATLALVFAMTGGAFAAGHYLITSTKQISPKVLKALKGAGGTNGAPGANGATGPAGPAGAAGAKGENGAAGANGANGTNGVNGTSVTNTALSAGANGSPCGAEGGAEFKVGSTATHACNGKTGFTETLPPEKTEMGTWGTTIGLHISGNAGVGVVPLSFNIPLAAALPEANVKIEPAGYAGTAEECPGTAEAPAAKVGFLCVYTTANELGATSSEGVYLTSPAGVVISFVSVSEGFFVFGTWAVTAP